MASAEAAGSIEQDVSRRESLEGSWILDKTKPYSMKDYLSVMHLDELAILAHEKGEQEQDTIQTINFSQEDGAVVVTLHKSSRVNNNLCVRLMLGQESVEYLQPGNRMKKQVATATKNMVESDATDEDAANLHYSELIIQSSLETLHGLATVRDHRRLVGPEECVDQTDTANANHNLYGSIMQQTLTIRNETTGETSATNRFFVPYLKVPPHILLLQQEELQVQE